MSRAILLILVMITITAALGIGTCGAAKIPAHAQDAGLAAVIGIAASIAGLAPLHLRTDRSPATLFQSAWAGSILHMGIAAALGLSLLFILKLSTAFVIWLLVMYWITLIGLCVSFVKTMQTIGNQIETEPKQRITAGEGALVEPTT